MEVKKGAIAVFAKSIGLSEVKTRLANDIGKEKAEEFYRLSLLAIQEVVSQVKIECDLIIDPFWARAEEESLQQVDNDSYPAIWTGEGGLGVRMFTIQSNLLLNYDFVILIGSDSPHIQPSLLLDAIKLIKEEPDTHVIGPAFDGGFYLYLSTEILPLEIWDEVEYSVATTKEQLINLMNNKGYKITELSFQHDVDEVSDLIMVKNELLKKGDLLKSQKNIKDWIINNIR